MKKIKRKEYNLLIEEEQEILHIPSLDVFGNDWETLQKFLERRGNPLYSVGGYLYLRNTNIESLGNLTSVGGSLDLEDCKNLTSLGNLTSVGVYLDLRGTKIESLGNLNSVGGNLFLRETPTSRKYSEKQIRQMVDVKHRIFL
jgi:hypothetical protein